MTNANEPAMPISEEATDRVDANVKIYTGLTKREYFAAMLTPDLEGYSIEGLEKMMRRPFPLFKDDPIGHFKFWAEVEGLLRCITADGLIAALNKPTDQ